MKTIKIANIFFDPATFIYAEETSGGIRIFLTGLSAEQQYVFVRFSKASARSEAFKQLQKDVETAIAWRK